MRKYHVSIFLILLSTFSAVAQTESNTPVDQSAETVNPIIMFLSTLDMNNLHLRSIVEDYFYGDTNDRTIDPSVVTEDFLAVVARFDSRLFSLSKQTLFDSLLYDIVVAATENISAMDARKVADIADDILTNNNDVLILEKAVGLYAAAVKQLDEDAQYTFARNTIFMLRRIVFSSDEYTPAHLIVKTVPYVTELVNKKIGSDTAFISALLNIFSETRVPYAYKTIRQLFTKIVMVGLS